MNDPEILHILSAMEIEHIDRINMDKKAADKMLEVALNYHANLTAALIEKEREFWNHIRVNINPEPPTMQLSNINNQVVVIAVEDDKEKDNE